MKPVLTVIPGGGLGGNYEEMKLLGKQLLPELVDPATRVVRAGSVAEVEALVRKFGLTRTSEAVYPANSQGKMIFLQKDRLLVRVKTIGEAMGRRNKAHMSVSLMNGKGLAWEDEQAKFNYRGDLLPKSITTTERFQGTWKTLADGSEGYGDHEKKHHRFVVIIDEDPGGRIGDRWADDTHFFFRTPVIS